MQELGDLVEQHGGIPFQSRGGNFVLPTGHRYKHVGSLTRDDSKMCTDVSYNMAAMRGSAKKLKTLVLANDAIEADTRVGVAHTHVMPCGEYGSGCWTRLTINEAQIVHRSVADVYRSIDGSNRRKTEPGVAIRTDLQVFSRLGVMSRRAGYALRELGCWCM